MEAAGRFFIGLQEQDHCCAGKGCPRAVSSHSCCLLKGQNKDKSIHVCPGKISQLALKMDLFIITHFYEREQQKVTQPFISTGR